jgi:cytochrome c biogenesis protein CcmG/thiol:disulfide interchange protein DsbE
MTRVKGTGSRPALMDRLLVALIVLCGLAASYGVYDAMRNKTIDAGDRSPSFQVTTASGASVTPTSFGGDLLLLNFWATWCPPCIEEMPSLEQFHRNYRDKGIVVLGVNVDESEQTYRNFVQRAGITFENTFDPGADLGARFGTFRYPETYLINRRGEVVEKFVGAEQWMSPQTLERITKHLPKG